MSSASSAGHTGILFLEDACGIARVMSCGRSLIVVAWLCAASSWALPAIAQDREQPEPDAESAAAVITPPALVADFPPSYPEDAFAEGVQGPVVLDIDIDREGKVARAVVKDAPDPRLAWSALGAVTNLRFSAARMGEEPIAVRVEYTLTFEIDEVTSERALTEDEAEALASDSEAEAPVNFTVRVLVAAERLRVPGALVWIEDTNVEAWADENGELSLRGVPAGKHVVHVEASGFQPFVAEEIFAPNVVTDVRYHLQRDATDGYETVVRGRKDQREVTKRVLTQQEVKRVPGTFGDALRVVQRLPGVARAPFGLGAIVIRGGAPDDSNILIDGHLTRLLFHLGAGPSIINSDVIERLELYPGGFGVKFGRSHAGVVEVVTRDPNFETFSGAATVDLLQTNFRLEGPVLGGAFFVAARRSYVAEVLNIGDVVGRFTDLGRTTFTLAPRYADYQAKLAWRLPHHQTLSLMLMGTDDKLDLTIDTAELAPGVPDRTGIAIGVHRFYPLWRFKSPTTHDDGRPIFRAEASPLVEYTYSQNRFDESLFALEVPRASFYANAELRPIESWGLTVGTDNTAGWFFFKTDVPFLLPDERLFPRPTTSDPPRFKAAGDVLGTSLAFFAETDVELGPLLLVSGLRSDLWSYYDRSQAVIDPRFAFRYDVLEYMTLKGNVGRYHKMPNPTELSKDFGNPDLPMEEGWQYGLGVETWLTRSLYLDWEVFYRSLTKLPVAVRSPLTFDPSGEPFIQPVGEGRIFGAELLLRQHLDHGFFGWLAYTLLRSERRYLDEDPARWRLAPLDQTHILSVALSYQLPWGFELGGAVRYVTGNPQTLAIGGIFDADRSRYLRVNGPPLGGRLPAFFQVDVRVDKRFVFDTWALGLFLDLQNATNHTNYELYTYNYDYSEVQGFPGLPILPVFGLEASF